MEMLRWLINNRVVQAAWGLGLIAVLLAWMFGGKSAEEMPTVSDGSAGVQQVADASSTAADASAESGDVSTGSGDALATGAAAVAATSAVVGQVASTSPANENADSDVVKADTTESDAQSSGADQETQVASGDADTTAPVADESNAANLGGLAEKSSEDLLMMAREAYWNNGLDEATELYTLLIEREPDVIEHKGELGNVLWRQGDAKKAAELYAEIAAPMIERGNSERVWNMVGFIGLHYPDKANEIKKLLTN